MTKKLRREINDQLQGVQDDFIYLCDLIDREDSDDIHDGIQGMMMSLNRTIHALSMSLGVCEMCGGSFSLVVPCQNCGATGIKGGYVCTHCNGTRKQSVECPDPCHDPETGEEERE